MARYVILDNNFKGWNAKFSRGVFNSLDDIGTDIERAAKRQRIPKGYHIHGIVGSIHKTRPRKRSGSKAEVTVEYKDWRGIFFELGTYKHRRRKLSRNRKSGSGQSGIVAGHMLARGLKQGAGNAERIFKRHLS